MISPVLGDLGRGLTSAIVQWWQLAFVPFIQVLWTAVREAFDFSHFWQQFILFWGTDRGKVWLQAIILLVVGYLVARLARLIFSLTMGRRLSPQQHMLMRRVVTYGVFGIFFCIALYKITDGDFRQLGWLVGTAGVLTLTFGFAAQTSVSNLISGLFLVSERAFEVGEYIRIGTTTGEVLSIDLLSTKLRTFDNLYVRVPNELIVKTPITNLSRFPIRRIDIKLRVTYTENIAHARERLFDLANKHPYVLTEPTPILFFTGFYESSVEVQFSVWVTQENYLTLLNGFQEQIKLAFEQGDIEVPFSHITVHQGEQRNSKQPVVIITDDDDDDIL